LWKGLYPTISTGGNAILISTPSGAHGLYYKMWTQAVAGLNDFNPIKLPWEVHPEHDQVWFDKETRGMSRKDIQQEYMCDFQASGDTFLQAEDLSYLFDTIRPPLKKEGADRNVWIWDEPFQGYKYIISADVSRGDANDFSTFHIIETSACNVVGEYKGKLPPDKLADLLFEYGKKYNNALIAPENNSFGFMTVSKLRELGYPKLYYDSARGNPYDYLPLSTGEVPGFSTTSKSRVQILSKLEELVRNKAFKTRSQRLYDELQGFIWNGSKALAKKDSNDDLVLSAAIGAWLVEVCFGANADEAELTGALLSAMSVTKFESPQELNAVRGQSTLVSWTSVDRKNPFKPKKIDKLGDIPQSLDISWLYK
jgi:hypothetical protein